MRAKGTRWFPTYKIAELLYECGGSGSPVQKLVVDVVSRFRHDMKLNPAGTGLVAWDFLLEVVVRLLTEVGRYENQQSVQPMPLNSEDYHEQDA